MLNPVDRRRFNELVAAAANDHLALIEGRETKTGKPVPLVVAIGQDGDQRPLTPLARILQGDPYAQFDPPSLP